MFDLTIYPKTKDCTKLNTIQCRLADEGGSYASIGVVDSINETQAGIIIRDPVHLRQLAAWATGSAAYLESLKP